MTKNLVRSLAAWLFLGVPGWAAEPILDVWPGKPPGETTEIGPERLLEQKPNEKQVKRLTDVTKPTVTVFRPAKEKDTGAAVLICPGGGYNILAWDLEGEEVAAWLNSLGITGVVLKYRVPRRPGQPKDKPPIGPLQDAQRAMSLVRSKASEMGIDPKRIGILGFSAGGHLSASVCTNFDRRAYEPLDEIDKVSCRPDFAVLVYPAYLTVEGKDELAEGIRVTKETPPTFLAHAGNDPIKADNSVVFYLALKRVGVSAELHVYTLGGHGFGLRPSELPCSTWPQRCAEWFLAQGIIRAAQPSPAKGMAQNPSPMVEHTRAHPRLNEERPGGKREKLSLGTLFVPERVKLEGSTPLFVHFHGGTWLPEVAATDHGRAAVIGVQLGQGSAVYAKAFAEPAAFGRMIEEAEAKAGVRFGPIGLTAWSAGYGAIRQILQTPETYERVRFVLLLDGLHAGYANGKPGPLESSLVEKDLEVFVRLARDAVEGRKQFILTHTEVFPGTFASTTETADYLLRHLGLKRTATLQWGPMQTQQLSEARRGKFRLTGYAGNSAPDHVDLLHALPEFLSWVDW